MSSEKKALKRFWKPDGRSISKTNQERLRRWMSHNGLSTAPGALTIFLHSAVHQSARAHALEALKIESK